MLCAKYSNLDCTSDGDDNNDGNDNDSSGDNHHGDNDLVVSDNNDYHDKIPIMTTTNIHVLCVHTYFYFFLNCDI